MASSFEMSTAANQIFSAFSFIGFILVTIPLPWHLEAWNTGTCLYMFWGGLGCLNYFINSVIWNNHATDLAPVWCDISTRIIIAQGVGIPAASLCINRRLYQIASVKSVTITKAQKRRAILVDLAIGLGLPLLDLPLAFITQGHRFNIFEQAGCFPATNNNPVAFVFVWTWPLAIGLVSAFYCGMTIRAFHRRRALFKELLSANNNLSADRYFRLMGLASIDLCCTIPISSYVIAQNITGGIEPWISWQNVHSNFSRVILVPALIWRNNTHMRNSVELTRWLTVACCFVFFAFFGFADEARKNYRSAFTTFARRIGYSTGSVGSGATSSTGARTGFPGMTSFGKGISSFGKGSLPVFVRKETKRTIDKDLTSTDLTSSAITSSYLEKDSARNSVDSVFNDLKIKNLTATANSSSSSASDSIRSPTPPPTQAEPALFTVPDPVPDPPILAEHPTDIV